MQLSLSDASSKKYFNRFLLIFQLFKFICGIYLYLFKQKFLKRELIFHKITPEDTKIYINNLNYKKTKYHIGFLLIATQVQVQMRYVHFFDLFQYSSMIALFLEISKRNDEHSEQSSWNLS